MSVRMCMFLCIVNVCAIFTVHIWRKKKEGEIQTEKARYRRGGGVESEEGNPERARDRRE